MDIEFELHHQISVWVLMKVEDPFCKALALHERIFNEIFKSVSLNLAKIFFFC